MSALRKLEENSLEHQWKDLSSLSSSQLAPIVTAPRQFGQLNISKPLAGELSDSLKFIEECLQEGLTGLAVEVAEELRFSFKNSPSLLVKILLEELADHLKSNCKRSRRTMVLNTLNMLITTRC